MVDSIGGAGQVQAVLKAQKSAETQKPQETKVSVKDEVSISREALALSDIENISKQASQQLADNKSATLSSDVKSLNTLA